MDKLPQRKVGRLPTWNYAAAGYYFVTVCTKDRERIFWERTDGVGATCGRSSFSRVGTWVNEEMMRLSYVYPGVTLDKYVIMPNHVHLILIVKRETGGRPQVAPTVSRIIQQFKGVITKRVGTPIWQKGFYDHIIRDEADYLRIWKYIDGNPAKWAEDEYYREGLG